MACTALRARHDWRETKKLLADTMRPEIQEAKTFVAGKTKTVTALRKG